VTEQWHGAFSTPGPDSGVAVGSVGDDLFSLATIGSSLTRISLQLYDGSPTASSATLRSSLKWPVKQPVFGTRATCMKAINGADGSPRVFVGGYKYVIPAQKLQPVHLMYGVNGQALELLWSSVLSFGSGDLVPVSVDGMNGVFAVGVQEQNTASWTDAVFVYAEDDPAERYKLYLPSGFHVTAVTMWATGSDFFLLWAAGSQVMTDGSIAYRVLMWDQTAVVGTDTRTDEILGLHGYDCRPVGMVLGTNGENVRVTGTAVPNGSTGPGDYLTARFDFDPSATTAT
jgi:hypothetical protein